MAQKNFKIKPECQEFIDFYRFKNKKVPEYEIINMCIKEVMRLNKEFQIHLRNKGKKVTS